MYGFVTSPGSISKMHAIPADPGLWSMDRFEDFIEARKALLRERFGGLIAASTND